MSKKTPQATRISGGKRGRAQPRRPHARTSAKSSQYHSIYKQLLLILSLPVEALIGLVDLFDAQIQKIQLKRKNEHKPKAQRQSLARKISPAPIAAVILSVLAVLMINVGANAKSQQLNEPSQRQTAIQLDIQPTETVAETTFPDKPKTEALTIKVKSGDSMGLLFKRAGIGSTLVHKLAYESTHGKEFANIQPGKHFNFYFNEDEKVERIEYVLSPLESYIAKRTDKGFDTEHQTEAPDVLPKVANGTIQSSFYLAGQEAKLSDRLIMELTAIFGWDIDFVFDIREGDHFTVIYEERYLNGEKLDNGKILAAEFVNQGKSYKAVRYQDNNGYTAYYTPSGESMRKAFLRTPLDVFRVSSHFNLKRKHPILNKIRAHKGTDYAAPRGTPVKSSGNGRVVYAAKQGGYGNVIKIQHGETYRTVYAHLDKFARKLRVGTRVNQGDVIGYVGTTGLSTAPHLHYEFYVNGSVRNPLTVNLPNGTPIQQSEMERFKAVTQTALALLENTTARYAGNRSVSPPPKS